jgi:hypothetical protein
MLLIRRHVATNTTGASTARMRLRKTRSESAAAKQKPRRRFAKRRSVAGEWLQPGDTCGIFMRIASAMGLVVVVIVAVGVVVAVVAANVVPAVARLLGLVIDIRRRATPATATARTTPTTTTTWTTKTELPQAAA